MKIEKSKESLSDFMEVLNNTKALETMKEFSEVGIDSLFQDGALKDIPILSTVISLVKLPIAVRELIYAKKSFVSLLK
jgi:hypothetical protein